MHCVEDNRREGPALFGRSAQPWEWQVVTRKEGAKQENPMQDAVLLKRHLT